MNRTNFIAASAQYIFFPGLALLLVFTVVAACSA